MNTLWKLELNVYFVRSMVTTNNRFISFYNTPVFCFHTLCLKYFINLCFVILFSIEFSCTLLPVVSHSLQDKGLPSLQSDSWMKGFGPNPPRWSSAGWWGWSQSLIGRQGVCTGLVSLAWVPKGIFWNPLHRYLYCLIGNTNNVKSYLQYRWQAWSPPSKTSTK